MASTHVTKDDSPPTAALCVRATCSIQRIWDASRVSNIRNVAAYPPISSIPRTSPERLALASPGHDSAAAGTELYLAYGSNLCAETFLGKRGIRPISQINVSAPEFDLVFDLPGFPYTEPCFANIAPRKIPKLPDPGDPRKPPIQLPPDTPPSLSDRPTWNKGLIGVVYEVTKQDFASIVQSEGGGAAYQVIPTPVVALSPPINVPEKSPIPDLPRPFLALTLYAPPAPPEPPNKKWWYRFVVPVSRPEGYAQPSARYLALVRNGADEHYLPTDYLAYLAKLEAYKVTQRRQMWGGWVLGLVWMPLFLIFWQLSKLVGDKNGTLPKWMGIVTAVWINLVWMSYDGLFFKVFGDGERTMDEGDDDGESMVGARTKDGRRWQSKYGAADEKNRLLADW